MQLETHALTRAYGAQTVLHNVSFAVERGAIVCLLGPSGCGKSTLLRIIAGLDQDYSGAVHFEKQPIDRVPVHQRGFGLMFQDFALFPHRTVGQNIAFGLRMQRVARPVIEQRVAAMLDLVGLPGYANRTIFELSGGERQRVALARSLAPEPRLLLLDEPLDALDRTLRERLTDDLRDIIKRVGITSVYVTRDQAEAFAIADRIVLMNRGEIVQHGTPAEVYAQPATIFAARFLGLNNVIDGQFAGNNGRVKFVQTALGPLQTTSPLTWHGDHGPLLIRPDAATFELHENVIEGEIVRSTFRGSTQRVVLRHASGTELELDIAAGDVPQSGVVRLALRPDRLTMIRADDQAGD